MLDFYGKELEVGDKVFYGSGYAAIKEGFVEKICVEREYISIRPYRDKSGEVSRVKHYHAVTGKWINPYDHQKVEAGYYHKETGNRLQYNWRNKTRYKTGTRGWNSMETEDNPYYVPEELAEYKSTVFKDYVKELKLKGGYVSVLYDSKGIVKL
jgi:hypothetical protein